MTDSLLRSIACNWTHSTTLAGGRATHNQCQVQQTMSVSDVYSKSKVSLVNNSDRRIVWFQIHTQLTG